MHQLEDGVEILRFARTVPNLLERALAFGSHLRRVADGAGHALSIAHFRDPWSGVPLLAEPRAARRARARE